MRVRWKLGPPGALAEDGVAALEARLGPLPR